MLSAIITAASCFTLALMRFILLMGSLNYGSEFVTAYSLLFKLTVMTTFALTGVYHVLRGKLFGNPLKRILCIVSSGLAFIQMIILLSGSRLLREELLASYVMVFFYLCLCKPLRPIRKRNKKKRRVR